MDLQRFFEFDPGEDPAWLARRQLGDAARRLADRCVDAEPDVASLERAVEHVEAALAVLTPGETPAQAYASGRFHQRPAVFLDRSAMFGHCNPVAPPMGLRWEEEVARCTMAFGLRHGGAPGIVHGGLIAAALDQVSGYCATMAGRSGLTIRLNTRYRRAVPVGLELEFDARVVEQTERATEIHARCVAADVVYAESTGTFARMDRERMRAVLGGA